MHLGVGEAVMARPVHLLDHPRVERLFNQFEQFVLAPVADREEGVVAEFAPNDCRQLEQLVRLMGEPVESATEAEPRSTGEVKAAQQSFAKLEERGGRASVR